MKEVEFHWLRYIGVAKGPKLLAYLVFLCFDKRRPEQKYCCSPKVNVLGPKISGWATVALHSSAAGSR